MLEDHARGDVSRLIGYGVSVPAAVQVTHEGDEPQVNDLTNLKKWSTVDLGYELHQQLRWSVRPRIDNDCRYEAFAEFRYGIGPKPRYLLYLKWSRTISIAILIPPKGKVLAGSEGGAVEIGFATAPDEEEPLNDIAGTDHLLGAGTKRRALASRVTEEAVRQVHAKDSEKFVRAAKAVGRTLAFAANLVNPDTIVIGGHFGRNAYDLDLGEDGDSLIRTTVEDEFRKHALPAAGKAYLRGSMIPAWPYQSDGAESDEYYAAIRGAITAVLTTDQPTYLLERLRR
jgi:predicted NBD/HSP70 family sugar kinase